MFMGMGNRQGRGYDVEGVWQLRCSGSKQWEKIASKEL